MHATSLDAGLQAGMERSEIVSLSDDAARLLETLRGGDDIRPPSSPP